MKHSETGYARLITRSDGSRYFAMPLHLKREDAVDWMSGPNQVNNMNPGWKAKVVKVRIEEVNAK